MNPSEVLDRLVAMSRRLGDPALDYVILGEGNSSARIDGKTFWVKASGAEMGAIGQNSFIQLRFDRLLPLLEQDGLDDEAVASGLAAAKVDPGAAQPSVESALHALALQLEGVNWVGHTHPTAVNSILCSQAVEAVIAGRLFPDEIVHCGPTSVYVPYTDPGLPLARRVKDLVGNFQRENGQTPKVILMQNHGLITLGKTASEVENITAMAVKAARILLGTLVLGGPRFLSPAAVNRIHSRLDENLRRQLWAR